MKSRHLIYRSIRDVLGGIEQAAKIAGVEIGTWRKYEEDPEESGREMPVPTLIRILEALRNINTQRAQELIDELLRHFTDPAGRLIVSREWVAEREIEWAALKNGKSLNGNSHKHVAGVCSVCSQPTVPAGVSRVARLFACTNPICVQSEM